MSDEYVPEHAAAEPAAPGKVDARRRRIRTAFQTALATSTVLLVAVPLALDALKQVVSPQTYAVLAGAAATVTAGATLVARVMASPAVADWIAQHAPWLSASAE